MDGFRDRVDAGRQLAAQLRGYATERPIILGLPRGGVPVGAEIARGLGAPLDVWIVRKLGVPWHQELGVGAVAEGGYVQLNHELIARIGLGEDEIAELIARKQGEVEQRTRKLRGDRPPPVLRDRTVLLVDDGIATGGTMRAAIQSVRAQRPRRLVLAVPVAAPDVVEALEREVDRVVCLRTPADLYAIGLWYEDFEQVPDEEVVRLLAQARRERTAAEAPSAP